MVKKLPEQFYTEVPDEKHYLLSDGSMIAVSYAEAVHYLDDNGEWDDVDNRFSYETKTGKE